MKRISVDELADRSDLVLIDVREPDEYAAGHVPHARNVPLGSVTRRAAELATFSPLAVICQSGRRSAQAVEALEVVGVHAVNVDGGTTAWAAAGRVLES